MTYTVQFKNKTDAMPYLLEETFTNQDAADRWSKLVQLNGYKLLRVIAS